MTKPADAIPRWLRTLPWLAGLLIGASAHLWWWTHHGPGPSLTSGEDSPTVHVHVHPATPTESTTPPASEPPPPATDQCASNQHGPRGAVLCNEQGCTIRRTFLQRLDQYPELMGPTRVVPYTSADGERYHKLFGIREGSLFDLLGIRNGDIIIEVNGFSMGDPQELSQLPGSFDTSQHLLVTLERKGVRHTMYYAIAND